jgi:hypothetical protein
MVPQGLVLAWMPRVDGVFLTEPPEYSVLRGHVSNVPLITGESISAFGQQIHLRRRKLR